MSYETVSNIRSGLEWYSMKLQALSGLPDPRGLRHRCGFVRVRVPRAELRGDVSTAAAGSGT